MASHARERSAWSYVGVGCLSLVLLGVLLVLGLGFWAYRGAARLKTELDDPVARTEKVRRLLGTETLPPGYHAALAFKVPLLTEVAILTGAEPDARGRIEQFGERGLIYLQLLAIGPKEQELREFFEGRAEGASPFDGHQIGIDDAEFIRRGRLSAGGADVFYVAQRGRVATHGMRGQGITSLVFVDCPADRRVRLAVWFGPDPDPDTPVTELDLAGTPADEAALVDFLGRFRLCG